MDDLAIWPEERVTRLRELWKKGITPRTISEIFGLTINAIEAKALALQLPEQPIIRIKEIPPSKDQPKTCLWPDSHDCGDPVLAGKPYCARHSKVAYLQPLTTKKVGVSV